MTTSYAQTVYATAAREVAEKGFIREATRHALLNLGHSDASVAGLEAYEKDKLETARSALANLH